MQPVRCGGREEIRNLRTTAGDGEERVLSVPSDEETPVESALLLGGKSEFQVPQVLRHVYSPVPRSQLPCE